MILMPWVFDSSPSKSVFDETFDERCLADFSSSDENQLSLVERSLSRVQRGRLL